MKMYRAWLCSLTATLVILAPLPVSSEQLTLITNNTRPVLKLSSKGSPNGTAFDDVANLTTDTSSILKIDTIAIGSLNQVDYIQVTYLLSNGSFYNASIHGDGIFTPDTITLGTDEYVSKIEGKTNGDYVNELTITTYSAKYRESNVYGPYGTPKLNATQDYVFEGNIVGFYGTVGKYVLNSIGVYTIAPVKKSDYYGYASMKTNFTDDPDATFPPVMRISALHVHHGTYINAIQAEYQLFGGSTLTGPRHGGQGGHMTTLRLAPDEHITGIKGETEEDEYFSTVCQLTFITTKKDGNVRYYGPYGKKGSKSFSVMDVNVVGLAGAVFKHSVGGFQVFYY